MNCTFGNEELKGLVSSALSLDLGDVKVIECEGLFAEIKNGKRTAGGASIPEKMRALALLAKYDGKDICIEQKRHFNDLGMMLDVSRGAVMRVEKIKDYLVKLALYGVNYFMLYTEDVYTLEEYPHFGYMRGAYTDDELMEIDDFASRLGIEVIPCIQTLGHHERYLSWSEANPIKDNAKVLLVGEEKTYDFIECMIKKMRRVFKSDKIHIGMDETYGLGLGGYLDKNGYRNSCEIYMEHLARVKAICDKYGYAPRMWSDMIFRINGGDYWTTDMKFSDEFTDSFPDVGLVYWEYGNKDQNLYSAMINQHKKLGRPLSFAGGIWTFKGFLPDTFNLTLKACIPALKACITEGVQDVLATTWGDDGSETDYFYALYSLAAYSEFCYKGLDATLDEIMSLGEFISGYPSELLKCCDAFFGDTHDFEIFGKNLFYGDIFYNIGGVDWQNSPRLGIIQDAAKAIDPKFRYEKLIMNIVLHKAEIYAHMQSDYKEGKDMSIYSKKLLPELKKEYEEFFRVYSDRWYKNYKPFGFEKITARIGGCILRIQAAIEITEKYSSGASSRIEELEYTPLYGQGHGITYNSIVAV